LILERLMEYSRLMELELDKIIKGML